MPWRDFAEELVGTSKEAIKKLAEYAEDYRIYPRSINKKGKSFFFLAKVEQKKKLIILNESKYFAAFSGEIEEFAGFKAKIAPLNNENAEKLRKFFPYTAPKTLGNKNPSIGLGDRLGLATPGHIDAVKESEVMPVFAQQSVRELNLTNRSFKDVIDDVSWAVFQEGYEDGFAADADHLKNKTEVEKALKIGYTMITLDCTDYIKNFSQDITFQELKTE
ncbi:MAG: tagaturonate epimerase, partial [Halanaerobium sp. MSAO_Bac5]